MERTKNFTFGALAMLLLVSVAVVILTLTGQVAWRTSSEVVVIGPYSYEVKCEGQEFRYNGGKHVELRGHVLSTSVSHWNGGVTSTTTFRADGGSLARYDVWGEIGTHYTGSEQDKERVVANTCMTAMKGVIHPM